MLLIALAFHQNQVQSLEPIRNTSQIMVKKKGGRNTCIQRIISLVCILQTLAPGKQITFLNLKGILFAHKLEITCCHIIGLLSNICTLYKTLLTNTVANKQQILPASSRPSWVSPSSVTSNSFTKLEGNSPDLPFSVPLHQPSSTCRQDMVLPVP